MCRLLTAASVLSLLLSVATLVLGIRSYHALEALHCWKGASSQGVVITKGQVLFWRQLLLDNPGSAGPLRFEIAWRTPARDMREYDSPGMTLHAGFGFGSIASRWYPVRQLEAPAWAISLLLGAPPVWWLASLRRRRQRQRRLAGLCPACGYDLRASTGQCPECGAPIQSTAGTDPGTGERG